MALAAGLAACSGDDSGTTTPVAVAAEVVAGPESGWDDAGFAPDVSTMRCGQSASEPSRGVSDTEITVGGLAYLTSPNGSSMAGVEDGAKARFERANAEGGVNGRKINYIGTLDDGYDPGRNSSQAKVLVDQKKVFAAVPVLTGYANYLDTFCSETVPFFGWGINDSFCKTTIGFGFTGCLVSKEDVGYLPTTYGLTIQALFGGDAKGKTTALVGVDNDTARQGLDYLERQMQTVGVNVVYKETPFAAAGTSDTTAAVNAIMTADKGSPPDVVLYGLDFNSTLKMTEALNAAGFEGKHLSTVSYDPRLAAAGLPALQKSYALLQWQPAIDTTIPAIKQLVDDFAKYAPTTALSLPAMAGYWSADMFITAATKAGRDLTVDNLLKFMNNNYSYYVEGAVGETRWPLNHVVSAPCTAVVQLDGAKYDTITKLVCGSLVKS
ncbi:ABC transporter substrate-binding protein [Parafrankia sp. FMc6]|uniref:ABC transporter substrate-binding protein n=1 Tax=Parafrankia soli TaxID=2599596 RepID=UPI0034D55650